MNADTESSVNSAILPPTEKERSWWACVFYLKCVAIGGDAQAEFFNVAIHATFINSCHIKIISSHITFQCDYATIQLADKQYIFIYAFFNFGLLVILIEGLIMRYMSSMHVSEQIGMQFYPHQTEIHYHYFLAFLYLIHRFCWGHQR